MAWPIHHAHAGAGHHLPDRRPPRPCIREDERRFLVLEVVHSARNNFDEDLRQALDQALPQVSQAQDGMQHPTPGGNAAADTPYYRNRFTAIRAATPCCGR
ncbi:MAG: hypothetical protein QM586_05510 [Xenophilus sp.]